MAVRVVPVEVDVRLLDAGPRPVGLHLEAPRNGPSLVVCANVHGDECSGIAAIHCLAERFSAGLRCGQVHLYPSLNPSGLAAKTRTLNPGGPDLNRWFPGDPEGTPVERLAHAWWTEIASRSAALVVDLHADASRSVPYAIVDRAMTRLGQRAVTGAESAAAATGWPVIRDYAEEDYLRYGLDRSLAGALLNHGGIPSITLEAGPRRAVDAVASAALEDAVWRIAVHLGVVAGEASAVSGTDGEWRRSTAFRAPIDGLLEPLVAAGAAVSAGEVIARVRTLDGCSVTSVVSPTRARILAWTDGPWVSAGVSLGTFAVAEAEVGA